jgi:hypothetical protein
MGAIIEIIMQVLAGVGLVWVGDKVLPDKTGAQPVGIASWGVLKITLFVVCMVAGGFILIFLSKKLGLKLFKSRR